MKKTTNNIKRRNNYILLAIMALMVSLMLVGCSSEATTETVKSEPEAVVKEEAPKVEEVVETKVPEEVAVAEEPIVEETVVEEPADALYIPEGIDMASTLPGEEWVASFVGNVAEPVVVIYNDNSGRKEVVQANSEVTINPDEDMIAVYWNEEQMVKKMHNIIAKETIDKGYYHVISLDSKEMRDIRERNAKVTVRGGAEDWIIEFTIISE